MLVCPCLPRARRLPSAGTRAAVKLRVCKRAGLRRGHRSVMATSAPNQDRNGYAPRLKQHYETEVRAQLKDELGSPIMQVPGSRRSRSTWASARPRPTRKRSTRGRPAHADRRPAGPDHGGRKSIAAFKLREGMAIGAKVTLRGARMYEFLDRLVSIALPRISDFRGLSPRASTAGETTRSESASRSSSRRSTTTTSTRFAGSTLRSRRLRGTTTRHWRSCASSASRSGRIGRTVWRRRA